MCEIRRPIKNQPYNNSVERLFRFFCLYSISLWIPAYNAFSQCIVINEILVNPLGNDGVPPNTSEWIELLNTCNSPVDIGCMIIGDGDFTLTIPSGITLQPGDVYTISAGLNGLTPDLNWNTCNCSSNLVQTGSLTDASEQFFLLDNTGNLLSGVFWGNGTFPALVSSVTANGCSALTGITLLDNTGFEVISVNEGTTNEQDCSGAWITSGIPSFGATNSDQVPSAVINVTSNVVCQGGTLNFDGSASSAFSYEWTFSNASPASSTDQNPIGILFTSFGNQTVTLTVENSCGDTDTETINVEVDEPILPVISASGPTTICGDESISLNTVAGGILQWRLDGADIAGETVNSITVNQSGTYSVTLTIGGCSATSTPVQVIVNPNPAMPTISASGATIFCQGGNVQLTSSASTGNLWSTNSQNQTITVTNADNYFVTITDANGCSATSNTISITVNQLPDVPIITANGPVTFCEGEDVTLTSSNANGFAWTNGANTQAITVSNSGIYAVTVTDQNGCSNNSANTTVTSNPLPNAVASLAANGISINATPVGGATYKWINCATNTIVAGQTTTNFAPTQNGSYAVIVTTQAGCADTSNCVSVSKLSIAELNSNDFTIYPNPAQNEINVQFNQGTTPNYLLQLMDINGRIISRFEVKNNIEKINTKELDRGVYLILIQNNKTLITRIISNGFYLPRRKIRIRWAILK